MLLCCPQCRQPISEDLIAQYFCLRCTDARPLCSECHQTRHRECGLTLPESWFQLVYLEPSPSEFDMIECSTENVSWIDKAEYRYVDSHDLSAYAQDHLIICNGEAMEASKSLHQSLARLRSFGWRRLWIARLCIKPADRASATSIIRVARAAASHSLSYKDSLNPELVAVTEWESADSGLALSRNHSISYQIEHAFQLFRINADAEMGVKAVELDFFSSQAFPDFTFVDLQIPEDTPWNHILVNGKGMKVPGIFHVWLGNVHKMPAKSFFFITNICENNKGSSSNEERTALVRSLASQEMVIRLPRYRYATLPDPNRSIRLLKLERLWPDRGPRQVPSLKLIVVNLDEAPPFAALSYTWGSAEHAVTVSCNITYSMEITRNLSYALQDLSELGYEYLWIDAVCINQADLAEKSAQVSRMIDIYRRATEVIVHPFPKCTRPDCDHSDGIDLINALASIAGLDKNTRTCRRITRADLETHGISPSANGAGWAQWAHIRSSPWFTRGWIVQEVVVNRNVQVLIYGVKVPFETILLANHALESEGIPINLSLAMTGRANLDTIGHIREDYWEGSHSRSMLDLAESSSRFNTTDLRDKVYAFLGLAKDRHSVPPPDYTLPVEQVLFDYSCYFVRQHPRGALRLIELAGCSGKNAKLPGVPSWTPSRVSTSRVRAERDLVLVEKSNGQSWSAGGGEIRMPPRLELDTKSLVVQGFVVGRITATTGFGRVLGFEVFEEKLAGEASHYPGIYQQAVKMINGKGMSVYADQVEAYAATVVAGRSEEKLPRASRTSLHAKITLPLAEEFSANEWEKGLTEEEKGYHFRVFHALEARRFAVTESGFMCLVEYECVPGDLVCVILGLRLPLVLRKKGRGGYELMGDCYVHEAMDGELLGKKELVEFTIQ